MRAEAHSEENWVIYPSEKFGSHLTVRPHHRAVGILLSREIMESAPRFSHWLSCTACCGSKVPFWNGRPSMLGSVGTDAALSRLRSLLSSHCSSLLSPLASVPALTESPRCPRSLQLPNLHGWYCIACLQISFTNIFEAKITPSCQSSSIHAAYMAKPAQPSLNEQGTPACARTSLFGIWSCQVMPKILLRQGRWKVLSLRSWRK